MSEYYVRSGKLKTIPSKISIKNQMRNKRNRTRFITRVAMFSALSFLFYILKFNIPGLFFVFLEINFSNIFIIIGSLLTGPVGSIIICFVRFILKLIAVGTDSGCIGELTDFVISLSIGLSASLIYLNKHDKLGGIIAIVTGFIMWNVMGLLMNILVTYNFYLEFFFKGDKEVLLGLVNVIFKKCTVDTLKEYYIYGIIIFNLSISSLECVITLLTYKKISTLLKRAGL